MLERETGRIISLIGQRTIGQSPSITLREVLASDILPPVRAFFRADVEMMLLEEHRTALKTSRFRHDHPDIRHAREQLHSALVLHYVFGREEFLGRLTDAVHLLANFLVRPQWTLSGVVFEKEEAIPVETLRRLMAYFSPYGYIPAVLFRYAAERNVSAFTKAEFPSLLRRIDSSFVRAKSGAELAGVLAPLYEFFDHPAGAAPLPVAALVKFFEDKGLTDVQTRLEGEMAQGLSALNQTDLAAILEDVRRTAGEFTAERVEAAPSDGAGPAVPDGAGSAPAGSAARGSGPATPGAVGAGPAVIPREGVGGRTSLGTPASRDAATAPPARLGTAPGSRPGPDVAAAIPEGERRKFVRRIFRQEEERFEEAMRQLAALPGWKEASRFIDEIFISNDVDPYCAEAERFTEIVFQQYHPPR